LEVAEVACSASRNAYDDASACWEDLRAELNRRGNKSPETTEDEEARDDRMHELVTAIVRAKRQAETCGLAALGALSALGHAEVRTPEPGPELLTYEINKMFTRRPRNKRPAVMHLKEGSGTACGTPYKLDQGRTDDRSKVTCKRCL